MNPGSDEDEALPDEPIGTGRPDFGLLLLASFELPWDFELEVNLGAAAVGQSSGYLAQALGSASLSHDLTSSLFGFFEVLLASRDQRDGRGSVSINTGLVYRVTSRLAVDTGIQTSLLGEAPDYVVRAGLSVRFGR